MASAERRSIVLSLGPDVEVPSLKYGSLDQTSLYHAAESFWMFRERAATLFVPTLAHIVTILPFLSYHLKTSTWLTSHAAYLPSAFVFWK